MYLVFYVGPLTWYKSAWFASALFLVINVSMVMKTVPAATGQKQVLAINFVYRFKYQTLT
jgi:hypothetical protein